MKLENSSVHSVAAQRWNREHSIWCLRDRTPDAPSCPRIKPNRCAASRTPKSYFAHPTPKTPFPTLFAYAPNWRMSHIAPIPAPGAAPATVSESSPALDDHGHDPAAYDWVPVLKKRRKDGWSPDKTRAFIEALADSGSVATPARSVGLSEYHPLSYLTRRASYWRDEPTPPQPPPRHGPPHRLRILPLSRRARPRPRRLRLGAGAEKAAQGRLVARQAARLYRGSGRQRLGRHRRAICRHVRILRLSPAPRAGGGGVRPRLGRGDRRGGEEIARRRLRTRAGRDRKSTR